jgi:hypothetical protein
MRSLSIGSPLLSSIRKVASRSSRGASSFITTLPVYPVLREIAPRACPAALQRAFVLGVMVSVWRYPVTLAGSVARTIFLISDWPGHSQELIEFWPITDFQLSQIEVHHFPVVRGQERLYRVWTSPQILQLGRKHTAGRWFGGLGRVQSRG